MTNSPPRQSPGNPTSMRYRSILGGPRPPRGPHNRGTTWDGLEVLFHSGNPEDVPDRASRRWALDLETEQKWLHLLRLHSQGLPDPAIPSGPSSAVDSRVPFFGPREPRRTTRSRNSPLTPYTPCTPFTPYTPDSPELETPDDIIPGPNGQCKEVISTDSDQSSSSAPENQVIPWWEYPGHITPFLVWEYNGNRRARESTAHTTDDNATYLSYASSLPSQSTMALPQVEMTPQRQWRVVNATSQDVETSSGSVVISAGSPNSTLLTSSSTNSRSPRPRLSIDTSVQAPRNNRIGGAHPRNVLAQPATADGVYNRSSNILSKSPMATEPSSAHGYTSNIMDRNIRAVPRDTNIPGLNIRRPGAVIGSSDIKGQLINKLTSDVLLDQSKYRALLFHRGDEAQLILDCLQVLLDSPLLRSHSRTMVLKALTRLSTKSGLYPRCFRLTDVKTLGGEAIDEGRYGDVWKASSHDQVVCLKVLRTYQRMPTQPLLKMLSNEALLWGQLSHPNILPFYGIHFGEVRKNRFGLVSPWMENGNVVNYLKSNPGAARIPLLHDIARGIRYLHSLDIVHGDIKGTNILVTSEGRACLADFGLSTLLGDHILVLSSQKPGCGGGTTRWKAPELFIQESIDAESTPTPATDVYSFSCAAYEILTGKIPFYECRGDTAIMWKIVHSRLTPSRPPAGSLGQGIEELSDEIWEFLEHCWNHEPEKRPSVEEILERLEAMMKSEELSRVRSNDSVPNIALSSPSFRKSVAQVDKPSDSDLFKVLSMISVPPSFWEP